jgi:HEAT repeat protein
MPFNTGKYEALLEAIKGGDAGGLQGACEQLLLKYKDMPAEPLLALKEQLHRLDLEHREAYVEEALISIAEKRPGPFRAIATEPGHPQWRQAVEVLSMVGEPEYLDLFISLLPLTDRRGQLELVRAIGRYTGPKVVEALARFLKEDDESLFFEALMAVKMSGGRDAVAALKDALEHKRRESSPDATVIEGVIKELEDPWAKG